MTKQKWIPPAGWVFWADYAASSAGKTGREGRSQRAFGRKKSRDICKASGVAPSIQ